MPVFGYIPWPVLLPTLSRASYLSVCCQLRQELIHIFESVALSKPVKNHIHCLRVIQGSRNKSQLRNLSRSEH